MGFWSPFSCGMEASLEGLQTAGGHGKSGVRWSFDLHHGLGGPLYLEHFMILQYPFTLFWNDLESSTFHSLILKWQMSH